MSETTEALLKMRVGDRVEALDPSTRKWRPAVLVREEPYRHTQGFRVQYIDATEQWHCWSGWQPVSCLRRVEVS